MTHLSSNPLLSTQNAMIDPQKHDRESQCLDDYHISIKYQPGKLNYLVMYHVCI